MQRRGLRAGFVLLLCLVSILGLSAGGLQAAGAQEGVIIECSGPCGPVATGVENLGGNVTLEYRNVNGIAATIREDRFAAVAGLPGAKTVVKDDLVAAPKPVGSVAGAPQKSLTADAIDATDAKTLDGAELQSLAGSHPANYSFNNSLTGASTLHAGGTLGQGVTVGVIDTGTANSPAVPALAGTVIGGENFVPGDPQSATSRRNDPHGTWVGGMIASHATFLFSSTSTLVRSLRIHAPSSVIECSTLSPPCPSTAAAVPVIGTAPSSSIYALKVFASTGGSAPESRVIEAMDRAITIRHNFNTGMPTVPVGGTGTEDDPFRYDSLKIQVVNMSLGGSTLFAGLDLEDLLTLAMLHEGITLVASAGNNGFPAMTGGSPGTGFGTLTVGAANEPVHERVLRDLQFGLGIGALWRPDNHIQTADFSSRGPTADGRLDPDVVANGYAIFAQGTCSGSPSCLAGTALAGFSLVSGTSLSSPTVAGAAALLRQAAPSASAAQIRNALIGSANPALLGDGSGPIDQGSGFINVPAARTLLATGTVSSNVLPRRFPSSSVKDNVAAAGFPAVTFSNDRFSRHLTNLRPGQVAHFFVPTKTTTDQLTVSLRNITPELPASQQNQLFGDDLFVQVADAPTSMNVLKVSAFANSDTTYTIDKPQTGLVRVGVQGDWTNAGRISADIVIEQHRATLPNETASGRIVQGNVIPIQVTMPPGTTQAVFSLSWLRDWGAYPTNDLDLLLTDPNGALRLDGITANSPERTVIANPAAGVWTASVGGFSILGSEQYSLRATADGVRLRANR